MKKSDFVAMLELASALTNDPDPEVVFSFRGTRADDKLTKIASREVVYTVATRTIKGAGADNPLEEIPAQFGTQPKSLEVALA